MKNDIAQHNSLGGPEAPPHLPNCQLKGPSDETGSKIASLNWPLIAIVTIGIMLRLWMISFSPLDPSYSNADDGDYYRRALRFAVTGQYIDDNWLIRPPLHVFFFACWLKLALLLGQPSLGIPLIKLAQTAVAGLTIVLGEAVGRRLFASAWAGLLFAIFLSIWYSFVEQPTVLFSELIYLFLFLLHFWLLLRFDASSRLRDLALSGIALGAATLTRSPALYSLAFVVLWLAIRAWSKDQRRETKGLAGDLPRRRSPWPLVLGHSSLVILCCLAVVLPWTARNYIVYQRFIPVDTLGQINLWLDLDAVDKRDDHINTLRQMPQADRAVYALARAREILAADPLRPFRPMWETFRHIWKAQFVEDFFVKRSFYTRPLRESAPLGLAGDVIWLIYTLGGLIGLAAPTREGLYNRLFVLAWLGYSFVTVLVFHVEPRYLLPIWTFLGLYGAWTLAKLRRPTLRPFDPSTRLRGAGPEDSLRRDRRSGQATGDKAIGPNNLAHSPPRPRVPSLSAVAQTALVIGFLALLLTYRDYPAILASGVARERGMLAGERAYAANDYPTAERDFRVALAAQPDFIDAQVGLALALAAQGRRAQAAALLSIGASRRSDLVVGALARDAGDITRARAITERIEQTAGEDIQAWALEWLRPPPRTQVTLGAGLDIGYISGFSSAEDDATQQFRWLKGAGRIVLPLPEPLRVANTIVLHMTGGRPGTTLLDVWIGDRWAGRVPVESGRWRDYRLPVPQELAGQPQLAITLRAPTFVPALLNPASDDARTLSLMISSVRVE
jgi:hypothetical protein